MSAGHTPEQSVKVSCADASAANDLVARREAIYAWAQGDPMLLSARCAKAEAELERLLAAALTSPQEGDPDA